MATGYPDFFGQQQFPKWGDLLFGTNAVVIPNTNVWTDIANIPGKLYFKDIELLAWGAVCDNTVDVRIFVDSGYATDMGWDWLKTYGGFKGIYRAWQLLCYDRVNDRYTMRYLNEMTTNNRMQIQGKSSVNAINMTSSIMYYQQT